MDIKIGDTSGCLEVIDNNKKLINDEINEFVRPLAEEDWNNFSGQKFDYSTQRYLNFKEYYNLNEGESKLYDNCLSMPDSFIDKFIEKGGFDFDLYTSSKFLSHKKKPNTFNELKVAVKEKKLYKVKCKICNRTYLTDRYSFECVKWQTCIGAECIKNTISNQTVDYSRSEYVWNSNSTTMQALNDKQLKKVEELSNPLTYYGGDSFLKIAYISDIHLMHHLKYYNNNENQMIRNVVSKLYKTMTMEKSEIIIFGGDISSDTSIAMKFYNSFMKRYDYINFKNFKKIIIKMKQDKKNLKYLDSSKLKYKLNKLNIKVNQNIKKLSQYFDFSNLKEYHDIYYSNIDFESTFENYKKTKTYKKLMLSEEIEGLIITITKLYDYRKKIETKIEECETKYNRILNSLQLYEKKYGKSIDAINITDYHEHTLLSDKKDVYVVLGNHEYIDFEDVSSCVSYYKSELSKIGINLLHNSYKEFGKFMIYGGTGFAKYDEKWNANRLVCCKNFTRREEEKETELFENGYKEVLAYAKQNKKCLLCVSHYPISSCMNNKYDRETIYFTGHNHHNEYVKSTEKILYADNQIGYKDNNIAFKIATTGYVLNPYIDMKDGLYITTIEDYLQFYRHIGENIGKGSTLYQRCKNGKANIYVIKRKGYYGFFILNPEGKSKGISIVNGGVTKKLTDSTDMGLICENFDIVLLKYLQALTPLRNIQEQFSKELKELGLSGNIHGCIVDINFYHHIMFNPNDGKITFYYSPNNGQVKILDSFDDVIHSLEEHKSKWDSLNLKNIKMKYIEKLRNKNSILSMISNNNLHKLEDKSLVDISEDIQFVSCKDGMYGLSRNISSLQRLFSGHVLRCFDIELSNYLTRDNEINVVSDI